MKRAFTLLELLVVIGIIAVLVGMGAVSYSTGQKKARDAKRKTDLKAVQNVMEQYYSICGYSYPDVSGGLTGSITCATTGTTLTYSYQDPLGSNYLCVGTCDTTQYTVCSPVVSGTSRLETQTCTSGSECCVSNQQ